VVVSELYTADNLQCSLW